MRTKPKYKENFPMFDELAPMIPRGCREEVRQTMQLLENVWRDDLCKATIVLIKKGKRKPYKRSRVMRTMFAKVITLIENSKNSKKSKKSKNSKNSKNS